MIEADGGTRCAAVTGGYLALHLAFKRAVDARVLKSLPLTDSVAAVSVGVVGGEPIVDLEYEEDSVAEVDMNVVMTGSGRLIEVQATAEAAPFERQMFDKLLALAEAGIGRIKDSQSAVIAQAYFGEIGTSRP